MQQTLKWEEGGNSVVQTWISETDYPAPKKVELADDFTKADFFYREASQGTAFIYRGDFQNARQLLQAVQRRIEATKNSNLTPVNPQADAVEMKEQFHRYRQTQAHRARILSRLLISVESDYNIKLKRAPDLRLAMSEALGAPSEEKNSQGISQDSFVISLREILGIIGAHEWRKKGIYVPCLQGNIHPHYGIFAPIRGEYLELVWKATLPIGLKQAFDIGTGTGVLAAILAKRGVEKIIATDLDNRAIACAKANVEKFGFAKQIQILQADLFPQGRADLIICNPPWLPARPTSRMERAVYDENHQMLKSFLAGVCAHLTAEGEAWLIFSDLAEHLGLRAIDDLRKWISQSILDVIECLETKPTHAKTQNITDSLFQARTKETTQLWRCKKSR